MKIIKRDGRTVEFDPQKVITSIKRTGAGQQVAERVANSVMAKVREGMTTHEVYAIVKAELAQEGDGFKGRYSLREAILRFGPAGFNFEKYVASILKAHNYKAMVCEDDLQGACVWHEVDVVAQKDGRSMMIEAKFRNSYRDMVHLKDTLATWARFLDLVDGASVGKCQHFDEVWIITNAKFSESAKQYGVCKGIQMIGWDFPRERSFASFVDNTSLYPVTTIDDLKTVEIEALSRHGFMLCKEIAGLEPDELSERMGVTEARAEQIISKCEQIIGRK